MFCIFNNSSRKILFFLSNESKTSEGLTDISKAQLSKMQGQVSISSHTIPHYFMATELVMLGFSQYIFNTLVP